MDNYYDINAQKFFDETVNVDMKHNYKDFLEKIPENGHILDAGCGSGRDSLYFKSLDYNVTAFDGSVEMCKLASKHIGEEVLHLQFQEINYENEFDGIWASSSLLHLDSDELEIVLNKLKKALKTEGALYSSFKYGNFEGKRNGRYFNDLTEEDAKFIFEKANFKIEKIWITQDVRKGRENEKWTNILVINE